MAAEDIVRKDLRWQEAMRKRGISDFDLCMIDPWSTPKRRARRRPRRRPLRLPAHLGARRPRGQRLRAPGRRRRHEGRPGHHDRGQRRRLRRHPGAKEEGQLLHGQDLRPGEHPVLPGGPRTDVKPLDITQHDGPSFEVDGYHLKWQKWDLRIGFTAREGLVLHRIKYDGRSIIHRASLSEMFVPYGDPGRCTTASWSSTRAEYGIGLLTNSLELGCDCLGEIAYLDGVVNDNDGKAVTLPNAICLHEEDARHRLEAHRLPHRLRGSPADAQDGRLQHRHRRQLRVRLLLVPVPGRHDRVRDQALRRDLQPASWRKGKSPSTASSSPPASTARTTSTSSTCASTWRSTAPPTGLRGHPDRRPGGPGKHRRQRLAGEGSPHRGRDHGQARGRPPGRAAYWRSPMRTSPTPSASQSPTSCCRTT